MSSNHSENFYSQALECWQYDNPVSNFDEVVVDPEIPMFLEAPPPPTNDENLTAGLRLVLTVQDTSTPLFRFGEAGLRSLALDPKASRLLESLLSSPNHAMIKLETMASDPVFVLKLPISPADHTDEMISYDVACFIIRLDLKLNVSTGFIITSQMQTAGALIAPQQVLDGIIRELRSDFNECGHSLFLFVKFCQRQSDTIVLRTHELYRDLLRSAYIPPNQDSQADLAHTVNVPVRLAFSENRLRQCGNTIAFLHQQVQWLKDVKIADGLPSSQTRELMNDIECRLEIVSSSLEQLPSLDSMKLIFRSQQDQGLNVELRKHRDLVAETEKIGDSPTDILVAFLTVLFVPSTFVATLLTMPLFDWSAPWDEVALKHRLWIYFAIDVPLTIIILVVVTFWVKKRGYNRALAKEKLSPEGTSRPDSLKGVTIGLQPWFTKRILRETV